MMTDTALLRAAIYRYFAAVFRYPAEDEWRTIVDASGETRACLGELGMNTAALDEFVAALSGHTREELEPIYVRTFLNALPSVLAPPYESVYVDEEMRLGVLARVADVYERCGLSLSADVAEMPDHIATELELMEYLRVEEHTTPEHREIIAATAREFLGEHLVPFARAMAGALPDGVYHHASQALLGFVVEEHE